MELAAGYFGNFLSLISRLIVLALLATLPGCVKPTVFPRYLTAADVINNVKCELFTAIYDTPQSEWLDGWTAAFTVTLQVFRQGGGSGELSLVVPYDLGTSKIGFNAGLDKSSKADISFDFVADKNLAVFMSTDQCAYNRDIQWGRNLSGETGLSVWFGEAIRSINKTKIEKNATGMTYNLEFVTMLDGSIKPAFDKVYPAVNDNARRFGGNFQLRRLRKDTNTLVIAFAKYEPPVAFGASGLGLALGGIQQALDASYDQERMARSKYRAAEAEMKEAQKMMQEAGRPGAQMTEDEADKMMGAAAANLRDADIEMKRARADTNRIISEAARASSGAGSPSTTEQTLNQLLTRNAIRNIPRR